MIYPDFNPLFVRVWYYKGIFGKIVALLAVVPFLLIDALYSILLWLEQIIPLDIDKGTSE